MNRPVLRSRARISLLSWALLAPAVAFAQSRAPRPAPYALRGVRLSLDSEERKTLILRDGLIEDILDAEAELPAGCLRVEGEGRLALPAFVDAYSFTGCDTPEPVIDMDRPAAVNANVWIDMREANRKGIQPEFAAVEVLDLGEKGAAAHRESGFGLLLSAPAGEILSGKSTLVTTRDAARRDLVVRDEVFQHAAFRASGDGYPSTLMGYHAQLRQLLWDSERQAQLEQRFAANRGGPRPNFDRSLDAGAELLAGDWRLACEASSATEIGRWIRLSEEFGFQIAISGGLEAWKCADELARRDIPVVLTLDWGEEVEDPDEVDSKKKGKKSKKKTPEGEDDEEEDAEVEEPEEQDDDAEVEEPEDEEEDESAEGAQDVSDDDEAQADAPDQESENDDPWAYEEPLDVRRERRRLWEEGRDCAQVLHAAGVRFAFGSAGEKPKELLKRVRTLVEAGLPRDVALAALTTAPSAMLGVGGGFGQLAAGSSAAVALWTDDPFAKKSKVAWLFVDGFAYDFDIEPAAEGDADTDGEGPAEGVDLTGTWSMETDGEQAGDSVVELQMESDGTLSGTISFDLAGDQRTESIEGSVSGTEVTMRVSMSVQGMDVSSKFEGDYEDGAVEGEMTIAFPGGEQQVGFTMTRAPQRARTEASDGARTQASDDARTQASDDGRTQASDDARTQASDDARTQASDDARTQASGQTRKGGL